MHHHDGLLGPSLSEGVQSASLVMTKGVPEDEDTQEP